MKQLQFIVFVLMSMGGTKAYAHHIEMADR